MSPPPSPVESTMVASGRARAAPGPREARPIDWYAVPTIIMRSGEATGQYMFAQPRKWPPSVTTTRSRVEARSQQLADPHRDRRGSRRPSGASGVARVRARAAATSSRSPPLARGSLAAARRAAPRRRGAHRRG
jgi:hypothetical protein